ncbi:hypothetical protein [Pseudoduganella aquatica]|uniref:DUF4156 domain-containing protein n=1 Tax=Pseudoduganella aquatica TaxID=2660641 RepID=A0A7X4KPR9_9BURK|nr:hypothetical protein [Pseudoduganella aquatica]MYN10195.1 hypothetical protein [Pseudoduganella aquatica]
MKKNLITLMLIPALSLLAACDSAPTDADVQQARRTQLEQSIGRKLSEGMESDIASMKIVECKKGELKSYDCAVATNAGARQVKLVKAEKAWMISQ